MWKKYLVYLAITILLFSGCQIEDKESLKAEIGLEKGKNREKMNEEGVLEFYKGYSIYTDPGENEKLYDELPEPLTDLCKLIKAQLIHPVADLPLYRDVIASERVNEDKEYPTVKSMLKGLNNYNQPGLIYERKPEERLILSCRYHAILLASILKSRDIPVRVRYGFANYLYPGHHIYHVICEVWNEKEQRWMLVDPDRQMVDFSREKFEYPGDVWLRYKQGKLNSSTYGLPEWWGVHPILSILCHDLASVLGNEHIYWDEPSLTTDSEMDEKDITPEQLDVLTRAANLLEDPDNNFEELKLLYDKYEFLQFKKND
ncbi:hypothetical protein R9X47_26010 [Wukongibacter baidiensis]|uniref:transglutaminase domain-containing protein n=1 Tax=Wukongibacter baidiensis TaxID=1723361 RepID=UPI003D7F433F